MQAGLGRERPEQRRAGILQLLPRERKERPASFHGGSAAVVHGRRATQHRRPPRGGGLCPYTTECIGGLQRSVCNRRPIHDPDLTAGTLLPTHAIPRSLRHSVSATTDGANMVEPLSTRVNGKLEVAMPVERSKVRKPGSHGDSILCDALASWLEPSLGIEGWRNLHLLRSIPYQVSQLGKQNFPLRRVGMGCSCIHHGPLSPCIVSFVLLLSALDPYTRHIPKPASLPRLGRNRFAAHHVWFHHDGGTKPRPSSHLPCASSSPPPPPRAAGLPRPFQSEPRDPHASRWD